MRDQQSLWLRVGLIAGLCHLLLVFGGAAGFDFSLFPGLERWLSVYGDISGSSYVYDFFAPGVTSQIRAVFDVEDGNSRRHRVELSEGVNREVDIRIGDIIEQFIGDDPDQQMQLQRDLAASLSGSLFARFPGAKSITVHLERFTPISMEEFRRGLRPEWVPLYSAEFVNKVARQ